ncbi:MAG: hypothetical protein KAY21_09910 [Limnohabitans sp.]|nr:hypothetical protein [Limnohabitans sp.]
MSPFNWQGQPSVFSKDRTFMPLGKNGLSQSEAATQLVVQAKAKGKSPGTITGMSKKADAILARRPHGGAYTKVVK